MDLVTTTIRVGRDVLDAADRLAERTSRDPSTLARTRRADVLRKALELGLAQLGEPTIEREA